LRSTIPGCIFVLRTYSDLTEKMKNCQNY
jgi:hypothetical protein